MRTSKVLIAIFLAVLGIIYGIWIFQTPSLTIVSALASFVLLSLFAVCGVRWIPQWLDAWNGEPEQDLTQSLGKRSLRRSYRHPFVKICLILLVSRILIYVLAYAISVWMHGYEGGLFNTLHLWNKGDAPHYLGIAQNWYVTEGDPRFHIVFFPLFPMIVKLVWYAVGDYFASGLIVSNLAAIGAGYLLYELALLDMDRKSALRAVKYQYILPAAFLLCAPMSDSLFLLLTVASMYCVRKKQYLLACVLGGLSAFTRSLGLIVLVPVAIEFIADILRERKAGTLLNKTRTRYIGRGFSLLLIPLGFIAYLAVNYTVTGNAFTFMTYQSEHWGQNLGWFFNTAAYQTTHLLSSAQVDPPQFFGLWLPNLIYLFGSLAVVLSAQKKMRPSYVAYFLAYFFVSMGATWLLSAPRYLTCAFPLCIALSKLTENRWVNLMVTVLCAVGLIAYLCAYVAGYPVY